MSLLRAVAGLRVGPGLVVDDRGERQFGGAAEDRQRAGEHHDRAGPQRAGGRQQRLGGAQVRPDAQVEVRLALAADRRGQVEDHLGARERARPGAPRIEQLAELAADRRHPLVGRQVRRDRGLVDQRHPGQRAGAAARHVERARGQQLPGQPRAQEPGSPGNHHVHHGTSRPFRCQLGQVDHGRAGAARLGRARDGLLDRGLHLGRAFHVRHVPGAVDQAGGPRRSPPRPARPG